MVDYGIRKGAVVDVHRGFGHFLKLCVAVFSNRESLSDHLFPFFNRNRIVIVGWKRLYGLDGHVCNLAYLVVIDVERGDRICC